MIRKTRRARKWVVVVARVLVVLARAVALFEVSKSRIFQFFGTLVNRVETTERVVALPFDDGPDPAGNQATLATFASVTRRRRPVRRHAGRSSAAGDRHGLPRQLGPLEQRRIRRFRLPRRSTPVHPLTYRVSIATSSFSSFRRSTGSWSAMSWWTTSSVVVTQSRAAVSVSVTRTSGWWSNSSWT